jgi:hypothetical protein
MPNSSGAAAPAANVPDLSPEAFVYVEKVRQTTRRLSVREPATEDLGGAVQSVRDVASFDVEVPVASARREVQLVKTGMKRLSVWYMRYLAAQLNAFGSSVVNLGDALTKRTDALASASDDLSVRLGAVEERLKRLERAAGGEKRAAPSTGNAKTTSARAPRTPRKAAPAKAGQ